MVLRLCKLLRCFIRKFVIFFNVFLCMTMSQDHEDIVSASGFHEALVGSFSLAPAEILDSNIFPVVRHNFITDLTFSLSATQINMVK